MHLQGTNHNLGPTSTNLQTAIGVLLGAPYGNLMYCIQLLMCGAQPSSRNVCNWKNDKGHR